MNSKYNMVPFWYKQNRAGKTIRKGRKRERKRQRLSRMVCHVIKYCTLIGYVINVLRILIKTSVQFYTI